MTKMCENCRVEKEEDCFHKLSSAFDGLHPKCKVCVNEYNREWRKNNPEAYRKTQSTYRKTEKYRQRHAEGQLHRYYMRTYGMSREEYRASKGKP